MYFVVSFILRGSIVHLSLANSCNDVIIKLPWTSISKTQGRVNKKGPIRHKPWPTHTFRDFLGCLWLSRPFKTSQWHFRLSRLLQTVKTVSDHQNRFILSRQFQNVTIFFLNVSQVSRKVSLGARKESYVARKVNHGARKVPHGARKESYGARKV